MAAAKSGLVNGYEDNTFRPDNTITRAEVVTVINRLLGLKATERAISLEHIENEELDALMGYVDRFGLENIVTNVEVLIKQICEYMGRDIEYYRMLARSKVLNNFIWRLIEIYYDKLLDIVLAYEKADNKEEANSYLIYVTSGAKAVVHAWLEGNVKRTPDEVADTVSRLVKLNMKYYD